LMPGQLEL